MITTERIEKMIETIKSSVTQTQFDNRVNIFNRIVKCIIESKSERNLYVKFLQDFPAWSAVFLNGDNGLPLFPSPWQCEYAELMENKMIWAFCTRKSGKSTLLSARTLHLVCAIPDWRVVVYSPTERQDFVYQDIRFPLCQLKIVGLERVQAKPRVEGQVDVGCRRIC